MISFRYRVYTILIVSLLFLASTIVSLLLWMVGFIPSQVMVHTLLTIGATFLFAVLVAIMFILVGIVMACIKDLRNRGL